MLRLNFTLGIWRISLDKLFQILTPFLEKDMYKIRTKLQQIAVSENLPKQSILPLSEKEVHHEERTNWMQITTFDKITNSAHANF